MVPRTLYICCEKLDRRSLAAGEVVGLFEKQGLGPKNRKANRIRGWPTSFYYIFRFTFVRISLLFGMLGMLVTLKLKSCSGTSNAIRFAK